MLFGEHRYAAQAKDLVRQTLGQNKTLEPVIVYKSHANPQKANLRLSSSDSATGTIGGSEAAPQPRAAQKEPMRLTAQKPQLRLSFKEADGSAAKRRPPVGEPVKIFKSNVAIASKLKQPRTALAREQTSVGKPKAQSLGSREATLPSHFLAASRQEYRLRESSTEANSDFHKQAEGTTRRSGIESSSFSKLHRKKVAPLELRKEPATKPRAGGLASSRQKSESKEGRNSDRLAAGHKASQQIKTKIMRYAPRGEKCKASKASPEKVSTLFKMQGKRLHSVDSTATLHSRTLSDKKVSDGMESKLCWPIETPTQASNLTSPKVNINLAASANVLMTLSAANRSNLQQFGPFFRQRTLARDPTVELDLGLKRNPNGSKPRAMADKALPPGNRKLTRQPSEKALACTSKQRKSVHSEAREVAEEHEKLVSRIAVLTRDMWPETDSTPE